MNKLPSFFIVGAAKAGTTSIASYLNSHPQVYFSPIKEPHYFSKDIRCKNFEPNYKKLMCFNQDKYFSTKPLKEIHAAFIEKEEHYKQLFDAMKEDEIGGEGSVGYLYSKEAPQAIKESIPDAKIIIILRNPIGRAFSHWLMDVRMGIVHGNNFLEAIEADINATNKSWGNSHLYVELGLYFEQVQRYFQTFGRENVKVILFDDLKISNANVMQDITGFLGLHSFEYDLEGKKNPAKLPKFPILHKIIRAMGLIKIGNIIIPQGLLQKVKESIYTTKNLPKLTPEDKKEMLAYFSQDIKSLAKLIDRDLDTWLK